MFKLNKTKMVVAQALACLALASCGGGADSTASLQESEATLGSTELDQAERVRWRSRDTVAPLLSIGTQSDVGSTGMISVGGTATDNMRLYGVRWANNRGGDGIAALSGTTLSATWVVAAIQLQTGDNTLTVTAEDAAGNTSRATKVVTYNGAAPAPEIGRAHV